MISCSRLCCRPFVNTYCAGVSADTFVLQNSVVIPYYDCAHTCVLQRAGVRGRSFRLRACVCFCLRVCQYMWCSACVFAHTHTRVLQQRRVRGHASAGGDILIEHVQLPACCTSFCSASGRRRWVCDHVVSCTHLCCRPFVTNYSVGVLADKKFLLQSSIWGHSI